LLFHQLIGSEIRRVVELGSSSAATIAVMPALAASWIPSARITTTILPTAVWSASISPLIATIAVVRAIGRTLQRLQGRLRFLPVRRNVLQEVDFVVEVNYKGHIFVLMKHLVEKGVTGVALLLQYATLAQTGVD